VSARAGFALWAEESAACWVARVTEPAQAVGASNSFAVAIPTRNRPAKLKWCLEALDRARDQSPFTVYVLDSSVEERMREEVRRVCAVFDFTILKHHDGNNLSMARNACARAVRERLIINVDDDIQVEPDAIVRLVAAYTAASGPRVIAGSVAWSGKWSQPVKLGPLGWGRYVGQGDTPDFLIGAFFAYPKGLALALDWNERTLPGPRNGVADDRYIGAVWRRAGVALLFEPRARAVHHSEHTVYGLPDEAARVYTTLVQGLIGSRSLRRTLSFEVLGFLQGAKTHLPQPAATKMFLKAWVSAHRAFFTDRHYLRQVIRREIPRRGW
jgi:glycosyltransferase involved in cell wall biosynthesis